MRLIDKGEHEKAKALIGSERRPPDFRPACLQRRRASRPARTGISRRPAPISRRRCTVASDDEALLYNLARVHIEKVAWKMAEEFIRKALKVNPAFQEGQLLLNYILAHQKA